MMPLSKSLRFPARTVNAAQHLWGYSVSDGGWRYGRVVSVWVWEYVGGVPHSS